MMMIRVVEDSPSWAEIEIPPLLGEGGVGTMERGKG